MAIIHFILQSKGGAGKSVCAALLCEALYEEGRTVIGIDVDANNKSFAAYARPGSDLGLPVASLEVTGGSFEEVQINKFDMLMAKIMATKQLTADSHVIIDSGASSFRTLRAYLLNVALGALAKLGHTVRFHVVITGGSDQMETLQCLKGLIQDFPTVEMALWLNPYDGELETNGRPFLKTEAFEKCRGRFMAVVALPLLCHEEMFREDLKDLFGHSRTFKAALASPDTPAWVAGRLETFWDLTKAAIVTSGATRGQQPNATTDQKA